MGAGGVKFPHMLIAERQITANFEATRFYFFKWHTVVLSTISAPLILLLCSRSEFHDCEQGKKKSKIKGSLATKVTQIEKKKVTITKIKMNPIARGQKYENDVCSRMS